MLFVNTLGEPEDMGVGLKQCPAVLSTPTRDTGIPFANTFPLPSAILSPQSMGSPILIIAGIFPLFPKYMHQTVNSIMLDHLKSFIVACTNLDPLAAVIAFLALMFIFMLWRATVSGKLDWQDMITSKGSNKVSLTKVLQLVGGVTGTWMMVYLTLRGTVSSDFFLTYLAYVGAIEGWSKFIAAKYGVSIPSTGSAPSAPSAPPTKAPMSAKVPDDQP
jgi:hypothetical protein